MIRSLPILVAGVVMAGCASHPDVAHQRPSSSGYAASTANRTGPVSPGWQRMAEGDPRAAQADFDNALQINPFDPIALNNVAVAKSENGQTHEAVALLERASRLAPENPEIAANLSRLRSYANSYALQGTDVGGADSVIEGAGAASVPASAGLPPPPPPLWSTLVRTDATAAPQDAGYYYDGCASARSKGKRKTAGAAAGCR